MTDDLKKKLDAITSDKPSTWSEEADFRIANKTWLKKSQQIALHILRVLREKEMSQKELAEKLNVSPQTVNKWVKGGENFTLETIDKIEKCLGISLISIETPSIQSSFQLYKFIDYTNVAEPEIEYSAVSEFKQQTKLESMQSLQLNMNILRAGVAN